MNVYDFDKTIFYPDSSFCFVKYAFTKHPVAVGKALLSAFGEYKKYRKDQSDALPVKEKLFSFLKDIEDLDLLLSNFWDENLYRIEPWYNEQKRSTDVIISASPEFLLDIPAKALGVKLIATRMDKHTGEILGRNCHDREKVTRFYAEYPDAVPDCFYSDSLSDSPMAEISKAAVLVKHGKLAPWPK